MRAQHPDPSSRVDRRQVRVDTEFTSECSIGHSEADVYSAARIYARPDAVEARLRKRRLLAFQFPGPDSIALRHGQHEDAAVANLAGARRLHDRLDRVVEIGRA